MVYFPIPEPDKAGKNIYFIKVCLVSANIFFKNILSDGGDYLNKTFSENPVDPYLKRFAFMLKVFIIFHLCLFYRYLFAFVGYLLFL
jgi:hypothetical protein